MTVRQLLCIGLSLAAATGVAHAAPSRCEAHLHAFDHAEREMALIDALGMIDDSLPRASHRLLEKQGWQQIQQMRLTEMLSEHCPPLPADLPAGGATYSEAAKACAVEHLSAPGAPPTATCDLSVWQRDGTKK